MICDRLNTHRSESLVRWVADLSGIEEDLVIKGECGILVSIAGRAAFLSDPSNTVVFHSTPHTELQAQHPDSQTPQTRFIHLC